MTVQCALYVGALIIFELPDYAHGYYSPNFSWYFVPIDPMHVPTKFEVRIALPVPEIIRVPNKFGQPLDTPTLPFLQNFLWAFIWIGPVNVLAKFEVRIFTRSRDNRGYPKKLDSPWIRPRSIFSKIFNGLLFGMAM